MRVSFKNKLPIFFYFLIILATLSFTVIKVKALPNNVLLEAEKFNLTGLSTVKTDDSTANGNSYVEFSQPINNSSFQPTAPYYAAFYYPWYKNTTTDGGYSYWNDHTNTPPATWFSHYLPDPKPNVFDPATELYSANDYNNFKWQVSKMAEAKLEVAISSWWGINTKEDVAFKNIINTFMPKADNPYPNLRWAMYYEKEGFGDPSLTELTADLNHIKTNYINSKYYLKVNNKPVIFVYGGAEDDIASTQTTTKRWKDANASVGNTFYIVLKVFAGYTADPNQPDNWHQYAPAVRSGFYGTSSAFVSPGFWLDDVPTTAARLGRNITEFKAELTKMVSGNYMWKLVETWNEWGEGTSIEPGQETSKDATGKEILNPNGTPFGNTYIEALNQALPALESGTGVGNITITPTPSITPSPISQITPTPTPSTGQSVVIAAVGDMAEGADNTCGSTSCKTKQVSDLISTINPTAFFALGDVQYEYGTLADFNKYYEPTYGRFKNITYPAIGNHEYLDPSATTHYAPDQVSYWTYFGRNGSTTQKPGAPTQGYYAFNLGSWRIYALNSNCSKVSGGGCAPTSDQVKWLKNDLATNPKTCQMIIMHHPFISSDSRGFDTNELKDIWQVFYDAGGDVILNGHSHFYERYVPINPSKVADSTKGIRQFIIGSGGKNIYDPADPLATCTSKGVAVECTSAVWGRAFGMLKMTLNNNSYSWQFIQIPNDVNPGFSDSGSSNCNI